MRYLAGNAQHIGSRHYQQDSFGFGDPEDGAFLEHGGFLAVMCDGMGGMQHGDAASRTAVQAILDAYGLKTPEETIPEALERSTREANRQVVALAEGLGFADGVGTTLVAAVLHENSLYFASVGDSALFHCTGGQAHMVNRPHVFANVLEQAVSRGSISREDAEAHPERESLTSFIGIASLQEIDRNTEPWPVRDGDTILLASDGMFKTLEPDEIWGCLRGHPQSWPQTLVARTLDKRRPGQDNVTVLSVTRASDALEDWVPEEQEEGPEEPEAVQSIFTAPAATASAPDTASDAKPRSLLWVVILLLGIAVAAASWWYLAHR